MNTTPSPSPAQFVAAHGDPTGWSSVDIEVHQHLAEVERFEVERVLAEHHVVDAPTSAPLTSA